MWDGDGKRASTTANGVTTTWTYDVNRGLPVVLQDGARSYVWGLGLAYSVQSTAAEYSHADGLGSVRALTDAAGVVTRTFEQDEFEVPWKVPLRYAREAWDRETGLVYLRARMYEPGIGRFLHRDQWTGGAQAASAVVARPGLTPC